MSKTYKLSGALLVDADGERRGDLYLRDGKILSVGPVEQPFDEELKLDGLSLLPAFIDLHTHLRDPGLTYKEDMESGMRAALQGGYAHVCAMANTKPVIETPELVEANLRKASRLRLCRLTQAAAAGVGLKDETPTDREALSRVTKLLSNDGQTIFSDEFMRQLLLDSRSYGFLISTHCQPERKIVRRDLQLLALTGGRLHIGHISHRETLEAIRQAKAQGLRFSCEVTPHHLLGHDSAYRVNPPLRSLEDTRALLEGCRDGSIDCLSTDHAPHSPQDKTQGMAGISNIEYAFSIFWRLFQENGIPLSRLSQMASQTPARLLGRNAGLLRPGMDADLVVVDTKAVRVLREQDMVSRSHNTPFGGEKLLGRVLYTIVEGEIRYAYDGRAGL